MNSNFRKLWNKLRIYHGAEALVAALFSLSVSGGIVWLIRDLLYGRTPVYTELVAGGTIWDGYNKQGDMRLFYLLYFLIPLFFCLFLYVKHSIKMPEIGKKTTAGLLERNKTADSLPEKWKTAGIFLAAAFLGMESVRAAGTAAAGRWPGRADELKVLGIAASILLVIGLCILAVLLKNRKKDLRGTGEKLLMFFQLFLPLQFLGYYKFFYWFESEEGLIQLFYSAKWKGFCFLMFLAFLLYQGFCVWKKKPGIYLSTLVMIAIGRVACTPEGILSVDFFHNGEMAFPMQQLVSYGKIPYFELDPIHGLCDYFYSLVNLVFFDGSYFAANAAIMAAGIFMAAFLAFVMGRCIRNSYAALLLIYVAIPYLVRSAGVRYVIFFVSFFILFHEGVRKDSRKFLWWWVMLCILGISWNVSIGSSMAVAFLPEILYRTVKDIFPMLKRLKTWEKREKKTFFAAYGVLFIIGICYIPWFWQILRFLSENAGTTLYVNGTPVFGDEFRPAATFLFLLPYLVALIYALRGGKKGKAAFISLFSCLLVISNYACVRYDEGARLTVLAVFFMVLYMGMLVGDEKEAKAIRLGAAGVCAVVTLWLSGGWVISVGPAVEAEQVPAAGTVRIMDEDMEDPIVFVSGESVGMPELGTGFIQASTLNSLKNIQKVLDAEAGEEGYLDLTNKISHYVIFDKESVLPFTSAYNISNRKMQEKAIALVEEKRPRLILIAPLIQFDLAPVSLRSMEFYTALIKMGYEPYIYEDVVYLLDGEPLLAEAQSGRRSLGLNFHKEHLDMLPYIWGTSMEKADDMLGLEPAGAHHEILWNQKDGETEKIAVDLKEDVNGMEVSYVAVSIPRQGANETWNLTFRSDVDGEEHRFSISSGNSIIQGEEEVTYLIPTGSSPFWQYSVIREFEISGVKEINSIEFWN